MNERIKELAEQAEIKFESHPQHLGIDTAVITPSDLEKFAELIIRECADCVDFYTSDGNGPASDVILNHFGVKE